jgi:hypothetical protein
MSLLINEYGQPIILFDATNTKERIKGVEAYRVRINIYLNILKLVKYFSCMWSCKCFT